jgi:hypothetical protein
MISINFQYFTVVYFQILCPYCSFFEVLRFYNFFIFHYCWLWDIYICIAPLMMTHKIISKQLEILIKLWSCKRDNFDKAFFEQIFRENIWRKLWSCKQAFIWETFVIFQTYFQLEIYLVPIEVNESWDSIYWINPTTVLGLSQVKTYIAISFRHWNFYVLSEEWCVVYDLLARLPNNWYWKLINKQLNAYFLSLINRRIKRKKNQTIIEDESKCQK